MSITSSIQAFDLRDIINQRPLFLFNLIQLINKSPLWTTWRIFQDQSFLQLAQVSFSSGLRAQYHAPALPSKCIPKAPILSTLETSPNAAHTLSCGKVKWQSDVAACSGIAEVVMMRW